MDTNSNNGYYSLTSSLNPYLVCEESEAQPVCSKTKRQSTTPTAYQRAQYHARLLRQEAKLVEETARLEKAQRKAQDHAERLQGQLQSKYDRLETLRMLSTDLFRRS